MCTVRTPIQLHHTTTSGEILDLLLFTPASEQAERLPCCATPWIRQKSSKFKLTSEGEEEPDRRSVSQKSICTWTFHFPYAIPTRTEAVSTLLHAQDVSNHHPLLLNGNTTDPTTAKTLVLFLAALKLFSSFITSTSNQRATKTATWLFEHGLIICPRTIWRNMDSRERCAVPRVPRRLNHKWNGLERRQEGGVEAGANERQDTWVSACS